MIILSIRFILLLVAWLILGTHEDGLDNTTINSIKFERGRCFIDDNEINEHMLCSSNNIGRLSENFIDYNLKTTKQWFQKHLMYAKMESNRFYYKKETQRKRIVWNKFPLIIRPFLLLFYRLILKMSILDGLYVIQYHFYHDFIYRMIIDIMILKKKIFKK